MPIRCRVCGEYRPFDVIAVRSIDTSAEFGLPHGSMGNNFQYCPDKPACVKAAAEFKGYAPAPKAT